MSARSPAARHARGEAGVEAGGRRHDAEAIRADDAQAFGARRLPHSLGDRVRAVAEPGGDHNRRGGANFAGRDHRIEHMLRRHGDNDEVGRRCEVGQRLGGAHAVDFGVAGIDEMHGTGECAQIRQDCAPERFRTGTAADDSDRTRREHRFQMIGRHRAPHSRQVAGDFPSCPMDMTTDRDGHSAMLRPGRKSGKPLRCNI